MKLSGQSLADRLIGQRGSFTLCLIAINVLCFGAQSLVDWLSPGWIENWLALSANGVRSGYEWQFFTYMFLHGGVMHLLVNMFTLYFAGREVEAIAGRAHFLGIYFLGGFVGGLAQILLSSGNNPLLGASAGVFAVLIAFTTIYPEVQLTCLIFFVIPLKMRAKYLAMLLVGSSLAFALTGTMQDIGHVAHLGGCLVGWLYVKRLGFGNPMRIQQYFSQKREFADRVRRMSPEEFISEEIDPILDKIAKEGIHSLTRMERKILEKGRDKIARKTSPHS
jgi:membrane associated rhomboid family serine protease